MTNDKHQWLQTWLTNIQRKMGSGLGEGLLINAASVIWED